MRFTSLAPTSCFDFPRFLRAFLLAALAFGLASTEARAQSCAGKVAGQVCRPAAGGCDVAESCVSSGSNPGAPLYTPTTGSLGTNTAWAYTMGYGFTPNKTIVVTSLGGFFNGTKTVRLYDRTNGAILATATVTAANNWAYASIAPVTLLLNNPYSVAVELGGSGAAYRSGITLPTVLADATINGSCYRYNSPAEPCASSGLVTSVNYGMADLKYLVSNPLYQPTDGTLYTDVNGDYVAGYGFTPNKTLTVTSLGGLWNGTKTVYLFNRTTGAVLASLPVTSANSWVYNRITPVTLTPGQPYTVAVYSSGAGAYRGGLTSMPSSRPDATIDGTCYRPGNTGEPCAVSGLIAGYNYGMADFKYAATGDSLYCPADTFLPSTTTCRAAAGGCDAAEKCTGSSAACPTNLFMPAGLSCNDGAACTYNDVCNGAGSCGGTTISCGGGNACSTTVCNGTSTCEAAKVFCMTPPNDCYNTLGTCNTTNGSCSYTLRVGGSCGNGGTCQSDGSCRPPLVVTPNSTSQGCPTTPPLDPPATPIGCDSCDPTRPCVVDHEITVPAEYQTCSGYTPRKGDLVLHAAVGLTTLLVQEFGSPFSHVGVFLEPRSIGGEQNLQMVVHHALNQDSIDDSAKRASTFRNILTSLKLDKNAAYCKTAKLNGMTLLDAGGFLPGVPNLHVADMITEPDGDGTRFWEDGVFARQVVIASNRAAGEQVADRMVARVGQDYYSLNSLLDEAKGRARLVNGRPGTNCASSIASCITPTVPTFLLPTDGMRRAATKAYELIRREVRWHPDTEKGVSDCKLLYGCPVSWLPCTVDCNGLAWETANGIADQIIACILFGPTPGAGCECTRENRKWHYAAWASAPYSPPTQDDVDWVNGRMTDYEFVQDPWTGSAAAGQPPVTIYPANTYRPTDLKNSPLYSGTAYDLKRVANAKRRYGHCYAPPTLTVTPSPSHSYAGQPINWTATASGGDVNTRRYAFFRKRAGAQDWTPPVTAPNWQTGRDYSWTPSSSDVGVWETYVWVKDAYTSPTQNGYGYAAGYNSGPVEVVTPPTLSLFCSPLTVSCGSSISCTATASGGVPSTRRYAFFRRKNGTTNWIPDPYAPSWQTGNTWTWTPACSDAGSWELYGWLKDSATPANAPYGYSVGAHGGVAQVNNPVLQSYPPTGWVDGFNAQHIWGWACDPDYPTQSNRIDVWSIWGHNLGSSGAYFGSSSAINNICRGGTSHYFDYWPSGGFPSGYRINVFSIDLPYSTPGNDNRKIGGSGSTGDGYEFLIP